VFLVAAYYVVLHLIVFILGLFLRLRLPMCYAVNDASTDFRGGGMDIIWKKKRTIYNQWHCTT
jgi:hypothetical protein